MIIYSSSVKKVIRKRLKFIADPVYRQRQIELRRDLQKTRREVGKWASEGVHLADPNRLFGIVSFTNVPIHAKFQCLVGKAVQLQGYTPLIFTFTGCRFAHQYFELFGIKHLVMWNEYVKEAAADAAKVAETTEALLATNGRLSDLIGVTYHGVDVGKHALSMACRKRVEGRLDLDNPEVLALVKDYLSQAVESVLVAEHFFERHQVEKLLVRDSGYIPNGAIYEVALEHDVDCVVYEQGQKRGTWVLKRYDRNTKGRHYFSLSDSTWEHIKKLPWTPVQEKQLRHEFDGRYRPDSTDDTRRLQTGKKVLSVGEVRQELGLDPNKKTAVIFSHLAWDAAFFYGTCLFDGFEDWLFETVKFAAKECSHLNWVVKLHPFNVFKLQRETKEEESEMRLLRSIMPLPDHIKIMRAGTRVNTFSLFSIVDYVLTVNGTVGMEFPCFGIPTVVAGTGRYSGRGFTIDPRSKDEYFAILKNLHNIPRLSPEEQTLARKHFLALTTRRQYSLQDVARVELKRLHEAQSDVHDNLIFLSRSLEEFQETPSLRHLSHWLAGSRTPDLMNPVRNIEEFILELSV